MTSVVFLGSDEVAAACLAELTRALRVELVVTQPPRRRGRRAPETGTAVAQAARALSLPVHETADVNAPESVARVVAAAAGLLVVVSFGQILRREVRAAAAGGGVNLHFSLLPRWRGAAPVQRALLAGDEETGVCVQRVAARLDAGPVLAERRTRIAPRDTTPALMSRLTEIGAPLLAGVVARLLAGDLVEGRPQDESLATYAAKISRDEGALDPASEDAHLLDRRVRVFADAPGCRARFVRADSSSVAVLVREAWPDERSGAAGCVLAASEDGIVVGARAGALRITRLVREGGRELDARSFLNGVRLRAGDRMARPVQRDDSSATSAS